MTDPMNTSRWEGRACYSCGDTADGEEVVYIQGCRRILPTCSKCHELIQDEDEEAAVEERAK